MAHLPAAMRVARAGSPVFERKTRSSVLACIMSSPTEVMQHSTVKACEASDQAFRDTFSVCGV